MQGVFCLAPQGKVEGYRYEIAQDYSYTQVGCAEFDIRQLIHYLEYDFKQDASS